MGHSSLSGHAVTNPSSPEAFKVCDRCGFWYNASQLSWQYQFAGFSLINLRLLVCPPCLDTPAPFLKSIVLPPDPLPISNPRPEAFVADEGPIQPAPAQPTTASQLYAQSLAGQGIPIPDE